MIKKDQTLWLNKDIKITKLASATLQASTCRQGIIRNLIENAQSGETADTSWECTRSEIPQETNDSDSRPPGEFSATSPLQFCLRWNNYQTNLTNVFDQLLQSESFVDVTLACDGRSLKAHKVVLSACSPYFQSLFFENPCQHPIVIIRDVTWPQLKAVVEFMYKGEINVSQEQLAPLLKVAEMLKIRGLTEVNPDHDVTEVKKSSPPDKEILTKRELPICDIDTPKSKIRRKNSPSHQSSNVHNTELGSPSYLDISATFLQSQINKSAISQQNCSYLTASVQPLPTLTPAPSATPVHNDSINLKPILAESRDDSQLKIWKSNQSLLGASTSSNSEFPGSPLKHNNKPMTWTQEQLQDAIHAVVTQRMRFTQASVKYGIPKGTLYDNILGKSKRMLVLDEAGLSNEEERTVLEFCCDVSVSPYNRRTRRSLATVLDFVERLRRVRDPEFTFTGLAGFRWWWAFCKKHSIVSLYYDNKALSNSTNIDSPA